jgi:hypothetical protein
MSEQSKVFTPQPQRATFLHEAELMCSCMNTSSMDSEISGDYSHEITYFGKLVDALKKLQDISEQKNKQYEFPFLEAKDMTNAQFIIDLRTKKMFTGVREKKGYKKIRDVEMWEIAPCLPSVGYFLIKSVTGKFRS